VYKGALKESGADAPDRLQYPMQVEDRMGLADLGKFAVVTRKDCETTLQFLGRQLMAPFFSLQPPKFELLPVSLYEVR
jgi:hypothetical protein